MKIISLFIFFLTLGFFYNAWAQTSLSVHLVYDNPILSPISNTKVQLKLGGVVVDTTTTDTLGNCIFSILIPGTYQCHPICTKPSGGINSSDALLVAKNFVHLNGFFLTGLHLVAAECDGIGVVPNALDAFIILHLFTGSPLVPGQPKWKYETININISGSGTTTQQIKMICTGDVNGSYIPL